MITVTRRHIRSLRGRKFFTLFTTEDGRVLRHFGRTGTQGQWESEQVDPSTIEDFAQRVIHAKLGHQKETITYALDVEVSTFAIDPDDFTPERLIEALEDHTSSSELEQPYGYVILIDTDPTTPGDHNPPFTWSLNDSSTYQVLGAILGDRPDADVLPADLPEVLERHWERVLGNEPLDD